MRRLMMLLCAGVMLMSAMAVYAHEVPDLARVGSITFSMNYDDTPLEGGSLEMYRVGDIQEEDGNYYFVLVEALAQSGISLEDMSDTSLAETLAEAVVETGLSCLTAQVQAGRVSFPQVKNGLYLVVQTQENSCEDFLPIRPFLISMPQYTQDGYVYEINCKPKVSLVSDESETPPDTPDPPPTGDRPLPVSLMFVSGMAIFILGWYPSYKRRRNTDET